MILTSTSTRGRIRSHLAGTCAVLAWGVSQPATADPLACVAPSQSHTLFALGCALSYLTAYLLVRGWLFARERATRTCSTS